ncbi:hypothetical protein MN608_06811 [Microdochium nivale]|nr:hypothetical protein MN608_06811 [Microdochium nivale]
MRNTLFRCPFRLLEYSLARDRPKAHQPLGWSAVDGSSKQPAGSWPIFRPCSLPLTPLGLFLLPTAAVLAQPESLRHARRVRQGTQGPLPWSHTIGTYPGHFPNQAGPELFRKSRFLQQDAQAVRLHRTPDSPTSENVRRCTTVF